MTTPIDIAELRRLLAAAVNSLGPLLDELETLRAEREADDKFEDDMADIAKMSDAECDAALKTAGFSQERIEQGLRDALSIVRMAKDVAAANEARDAARAEAAKLREALECVATTEPDGLCWCNPIIHADTRAAFGHAGWCKKARAALGKEKL